MHKFWNFTDGGDVRILRIEDKIIKKIKKIKKVKKVLIL